MPFPNLLTESTELPAAAGDDVAVALWSGTFAPCDQREMPMKSMPMASQDANLRSARGRSTVAADVRRRRPQALGKIHLVTSAATSGRLKGSAGSGTDRRGVVLFICQSLCQISGASSRAICRLLNPVMAELFEKMNANGRR